jgi:hypothetical protein
VGESFTVCPVCGRHVEPNDPDLVYGLKQVESVGMGPTRQVSDGIGAYFHPDCFPFAANHREAPRPTSP